VEVSIKNDKIIYKLLNDPMYLIEEDGLVLVRKPSKGSYKRDVPIEELPWRTKFCATQGGYSRVKYRGIWLLIHRVVFAKFVGELSDKEINHKDGNPSNNHFSNLELVTTSENLIHSYRKLGRAKVRNFKYHEDVEEAVMAAHKGGDGYKKVAKTFNIPVSTIAYMIKRNLSEGHKRQSSKGEPTILGV